MTGRKVALVVGTLAGLLLILSHDDMARLFSTAAPTWADSIEDRVNLLSAAQRGSVAEYHAALLEAHDIDYRVLAVGEGGDINLSAHEYFEVEGVGTRSTNGRGLLLVIDTELDRVRLEVSTSLEGVYTDAFIAYVQTRQMVPFFQSGRVADGILATTELIVSQAQESEAGKAFAPPMPARSMGAGATSTAGIGAAVRRAADTPAIDAATRASSGNINASQLGPLQVVETYHDAMATRDGRRDLPIYSAATVRMLDNWVMTPAQMDNVARTVRTCHVEDVRVRGDLAVVRYDVEQRHCAPYFLHSENEAWKLDLASMSAAIGFNHENQWHFRMPMSSRYTFAFEDWRFDDNGFPHSAARD